MQGNDLVLPQLLILGAVIIIVLGWREYLLRKVTAAFAAGIGITGMGFLMQATAKAMGVHREPNVLTVLGYVTALSGLLFMHWLRRNGRDRPDHSP
jgi:hypothetical protein